MGFRLNRTYELRWDSGQLEGLEVDVKATSVATIVELREMSLKEDAVKVCELLAEHVTAWNYDDEQGKPLPVVGASFLALEEPVLAAIVKEWFRAAVGMSAPLDEPSTSTPPSPVDSLPMEAL